MEDVYRRLGAAVQLWKIKDAPNASSRIEVTESWYDHETDKVAIEDRSVGPDGMADWLQRTTRPSSSSGTETLVMRLVWIRVDPDKLHFNVSKTIRQLLLKAWGLSLAYDYFQTYVTGITKLPDKDTADGPREAYAFSYAPKLAAVWSNTLRPPPFRCATLTQGIVFVREPAHSSQPEEQVIGILRRSLTSSWDAGLVCYPLFPAYLLSLLLSIQIDLTQQYIKTHVQMLEARTGHHDFKTRREDAAKGFMQALSQKASGLSTKLASVSRKSKTVDHLLTIISDRLDLQAGWVAENLSIDSSVSRETRELLRSQINVLRYRHEMQVLDTQYIQKRVEIQIQAVFHIIAQNDSFSNYKLSQHMAQTAEFSYRDAASMKTLAVVTMFFLPGSFVSALFSTQLFAWDDVSKDSSSIAVPTMPQMTLYWIVTIPLTLLTFALYFLWLWYQKRERRNNFKSDKQMDADAAAGADGDETKEEAWRRQTFMSEVKFSQKV